MKYFGTDGYRGEANVSLMVDEAYKIGKFLGYYYKQQGKEGKIVIGKDTRRSSYMFENALAAGITASGGDAYLLHVTTTPSVSYIVRADDFDCGIMISASHNPYYDNGIKLMNSEGYKMEESVLEEIESYMDGIYGEIPYAQRNEIGKTIDYFSGRNRYVAYLISTVTRSFKGVKVGLDCANGSSFMIAKNVFDALGADTFVINNKPDGININENAGSTHIKNLVEFVKKENLDVGFAYDGDADRCIAVDNNGEVMDGDTILYMCANELKETGELRSNKVVTTVMSNMGLYKALDKLEIGYEITDVGDKNVSKCMTDNNYMLGGEQSGHIIFSKYSQAGDGILTSLRMMEVMLANKTDFASLHRDFKVYPQLLRNVKVKDKVITMEDEEVKKSIEEVKEYLGDNGRVLVRLSGTEPLVRVMVEAESDAICKETVDKIVKKIIERGHGVS